jgi:hypothetical protein
MIPIEWPVNPKLAEVQVGDFVIRMLAGVMPMRLRVTARTPDLIVCGEWTFDARSGAEIDEYLEWGPAFGTTGSFIVARDMT